jgi:hypothetical protein
MDRIIYCVLEDDRSIRCATFDKDEAHEIGLRVGKAVAAKVFDDKEILDRAMGQAIDPLQNLCLRHRHVDEDMIVYVTVANPGGVDGRDAADKGGQIRFASFERSAAESRRNGWVTLDKVVVNPREVAARTLARFNPVVRLIVDEHLEREAPAPVLRTPGL